MFAAIKTEEEVLGSISSYTIPDPRTLTPVNQLPLFKTSRHKWYPNLIYDTKTKNRSFVLEHLRMKKMGVANNDWMLVLLQPELQGVDPHDPNLDAVTQAKIAVECRLNPIYYFREVARLKGDNVDGWVPFKASRLNLAQIFLYFAGVGALYVAPRQQGKTTGMYILDFYLMNFWFKNARINLFTIKIKNGIDAIALMKQVRDMTPEYLCPRSYGDGNGREKLRIDSRNCEWSFIVNASSVHDADAKGRGLTTSQPRWDEFAYIKWLKKTLMAANPGTTTAMEQAEASGLPNGRILATTAGELDTESGAYAYTIASSAYPFTEHLYSCVSRQHIRNVVEVGSRNNLVYAEFSYLQLGKDREWLERQRKLNNYDKLTIEKDFLNIWSRGSSTGLLTKTHKDRLAKNEVDPTYIDIKDSLITFRWYCEAGEITKRLNDEAHILTIDTSDGIGSDGNGIYLTNSIDTETLMATSINEVNSITLANVIANFLIDNKRVLLNIEAKNIARAFIDALVLKLVAAGEDPFKRIYNRVVSNPEDHPKLYKEAMSPMSRRSPDIYNKAKKYFGFNTSSTSRELLYGTVLSTALKNSASVVKDKPLTKELLSLTVKNGRIDHTASGNDDLVIAWLIAHWTLLYGKNLDHYGLETNRLMKGVSAAGGVATEEEIIKRARINMIRSEIDDYKNKLLDTTNPLLQHKYEVKLKSLVTMHGHFSDEPISINDIVTEISEKRQMSRPVKWKNF